MYSQDFGCRWVWISPEDIEIALLGFEIFFFFLVCCYTSSFIYQKVIWSFHSFSFSVQGVSSLRTLMLNISCKVMYFFPQAEEGELFGDMARGSESCSQFLLHCQKPNNLSELVQIRITRRRGWTIDERGKYGVTEALSISLYLKHSHYSCWMFFLWKVNKNKKLALPIRWGLRYFVLETKSHIVFSSENHAV